MSNRDIDEWLGRLLIVLVLLIGFALVVLLIAAGIEAVL